MLEAGPWSYVVKLLFLNTSSILAHDSSLFSLSFSLLNSFFFYYYYLLFFFSFSNLPSLTIVKPRHHRDTPTLHERQIAHRSQILMNGCGSTKASFSPFLQKSPPPRESRTRLASEFLLVDLIRRCIGGVQNGAVEDWNWSGFVVFFYPPTCLS